MLSNLAITLQNFITKFGKIDRIVNCQFFGTENRISSIALNVILAINSLYHNGIIINKNYFEIRQNFNKSTKAEERLCGKETFLPKPVVCLAWVITLWQIDATCSVDRRRRNKAYGENKRKHWISSGTGSQTRKSAGYTLISAWNCMRNRHTTVDCVEQRKQKSEAQVLYKQTARALTEENKNSWLLCYINQHICLQKIWHSCGKLLFESLRLMEIISNQVSMFQTQH